MSALVAISEAMTLRLGVGAAGRVQYGCPVRVLRVRIRRTLKQRGDNGGIFSQRDRSGEYPTRINDPNAHSMVHRSASLRTRSKNLVHHMLRPDRS